MDHTALAADLETARRQRIAKREQTRRDAADGQRALGRAVADEIYNRALLDAIETESRRTRAIARAASVIVGSAR